MIIMTKAFVNKGYKKIEGTPEFEAKQKKLKDTLSANELEVALEKERFLLSDDANGVLVGIGIDPKIKPDKDSKQFTLYDDNVPILKVDKNNLIQACQVLYQSDNSKGINYLIPLMEHSILIEYKFQNRIEASGDLKGIFFFFKDST